MKTIIKILIIGIIVFPVVFSCTKESKSFGLKDFSYSGCKSHQKNLTTNQSSDEKEVIEIKSDNGYLEITHKNVYFNCEPGKIIAKASLKDTVITISEEETKHDVNCICLYDLSLKLGPLNFGTYYFSITRGNAEYTHFTIDYHANIDTTFEVNKY